MFQEITVYYTRGGHSLYDGNYPPPNYRTPQMLDVTAYIFLT